MRYEKKMLILSGAGKGVVLIEKSGLGVRFALRTFGLARASGRKAGIVTSTDVYVRDLPDGADPSLVFYLDGADTEQLHFAVFDTELLLYGTNGKRMWEANLMGLFRAHDRAARPPEIFPAALPPLIQKPEVLPLPDGTGIPQSRDILYGDEALSANDFYTGLDMKERMKIVDGFLDTPRVLVDTPSPVRRLDNPSIVSFSETAAEPLADQLAEKVAEPIADRSDDRSDAEITVQPVAEISRQPDDGTTDNENVEETGKAVDTMFEQEREEMKLDTRVSDGYVANGSVVESEAAATVDSPWRKEAEFLCKMSKRELVTEKTSVKPVKARESVPKLRETEFFERARGDIDKLFKTAERDGELSALLPDLQWVAVEFDGHTVSVGRANEFLCYAVAGIYEKCSPFGEQAQWLPRVKSAPTGKGYWLVFQDINTGEILAS